MGDALGLFNYWVYVLLMMMGLYAAIAKPHLVKKVIGLALFQTGIFVFYISLGVVKAGDGIGAVPIFYGHGHPPPTGPDGAALEVVYSNPLPHVLILTAIVVSVSTMAVALAIVVNIKREFGTVESDELRELEQQQRDREASE